MQNHKLNEAKSINTITKTKKNIGIIKKRLYLGQHRAINKVLSSKA